MLIEFNEHVLRCPCCRYKRFGHFDRFTHNEIILNYKICKKCELVFMSPRMSSNDTARFYKESYQELYLGQVDPTRENIDFQKKRAQHLISLVAAHENSIKSHLDIGSSTGQLLVAAKERFSGIFSAGIEPSIAYRNWSVKQHGVEAYSSLDEFLSKSKTRFQLVTASHSLEHMHNPVEALTRIREQIITPNGLLLIEVPNLFGHVSYEIAHILCFSPDTLKRLLVATGWEIIDQKIHSIPRPGTGNHYITVLARPTMTIHLKRMKSALGSWRLTKLRRIKGLSGYTWTQGAIKAFLKILKRGKLD